MKHLYEDVEKQAILRWWLSIALRNAPQVDQAKFLSGMITHERTKNAEGAWGVLTQLGMWMGRRPRTSSRGFWSSPPGSAPEYVPGWWSLKGYYVDPSDRRYSDRYDLCWIPAWGMWTFNVEGPGWGPVPAVAAPASPPAPAPAEPIVDDEARRIVDELLRRHGLRR